jgi:hypothetical protein
MNKCFVRKNVESAVKWLFENHNEEMVVQINNITLKFICTSIDKKSQDPFYYKIDVCREDKTIESFIVGGGYIMSTWELISTPWMNDYINDITDVVIDNLNIHNFIDIDIKYIKYIKSE